MSALTLRLKIAPPERLDLSALTPSALAGKSARDVAELVVARGKYPVRAGDAFDISGTPGDTLVIEGGSDRLDFVGAHADAGTITVDGDVGAYAGHKMRSGRLEIRGNAGPYLASSLSDGLVVVAGSAGDYLGVPRRGERDGIAGGNIVIKGAVGDFAGSRMRRGTIIAHGGVGANAGARMMGGTVWGLQGFGASPGVQMRRGLLLAPTMDTMLSTFVDCGHHDLGILRIMNRYLKTTLGDLAPELEVDRVHKFAGDMASLGKGEILLTG